MVELARFYASRGLKISRASMQYVWDVDGVRYLDLHTGHGAAFLGHGNPRIVKRVYRQWMEIGVCTPQFECNIQAEASRLLSSILPEGWSVFFQNSGAEAVEAALKAAWLYTGRVRVAAFKGSFHGRTLAALSVTWNPKYRSGLPALEMVDFLPFNNVSGLDAIGDEHAAVIVEPVQGEGGVVPASIDFLREVAKAARRAGALLILDEIQAGFGRTGYTWAYQRAGIEPDILVAGKSIGGGFPVSMVAARKDIVEALKGRHGSTHGGNPLALAAVAGGVEVLTSEDVPAKAMVRGKELMELLAGIESLRGVRHVRGLGLMAGVELRRNPGPVLRCLQERRILAIKAGITVVRLLPPYMVTPEDLGVAVDGLRECIRREAGG
ncbi:MAG: aspartate aminotransferase family protein [Desulfurococcales archaeon]|nr:aspartate aminotransferase family protein [Desulfurococcales archaeon]